MDVGVPREIKVQEYRVALVPAGVKALREADHRVLVQAGAGAGSGFHDEDYRSVGAEILDSAEEVFEKSRLILKVKEPLPSEFGLLNENHILFTYLHLAADADLTQALRKSGATAIAYETVQLPNGVLPLLVPMSEVAGRMSIQVGAATLEKHHGGRGVLLGGIPGVRPGRVAILGGGTVGSNAARMAVGMGADVVVLDIAAEPLEQLDRVYQGRLKTVVSNAHVLREEMVGADLVVGAVLVTGGKAPHLAGRDVVREMTPGAVIVDVAIDQGGCIETSRPTTHEQPVFMEEGVAHYCVTNMPGAVSRTSTIGLTNATLPYALRLANAGLEGVAADPPLTAGVNIHRGRVCHPAVAEAMGTSHEPFAP